MISVFIQIINNMFDKTEKLSSFWSVDYRLGYLYGRLRGYESEDDIVLGYYEGK